MTDELINPERAHDVLEAFDRGKSAAEAIAVGSTFLGALPAADAVGYRAHLDPLLRSVFVGAYLMHMPTRICTDRTGLVTECRR